MRATRATKKKASVKRGAKARPRKPRLPQTASTRTEAAMAERLDSLEPGSKRYDVLACAIEFKRSWIHLARQLTEVRNEAHYKEWGYRTFEAYVQHELYIRRDTATKLVRSFDFLASHEKPLLRQVEDLDQDHAIAPLPNFQALDILAEARNNPNLTERDYKEIRDTVFRDDPAPSAVRKLVKERAPEPVKARAEDPSEALRKCLSLAERLYGMLLEEEVPDNICEHVEKAVGGLRKLLDE
jgi:hypothetical protein